MTTNFIEKRKHIRVYFEPPNTPAGTLSLNASSNSVPCIVWGISAGGLRLSIDGKQLFIKKDRVRLRQLEFPGEKALPDQDMELEVSWSIVQQDSNRTYLGCRFMNLSSRTHQAIVDIVKTELKKKNLPAGS